MAKKGKSKQKLATRGNLGAAIKRPVTKEDIKALAIKLNTTLVSNEQFKLGMARIDQALQNQTAQLLKHDEKFTRIDQALQNQTAQLLKHDEKFTRIDQALQNQALKLLQHDRQFEEIKDFILSAKSEILSAVDAFAKDTKDMERDTTLQSGHLADHDQQLKNHEERLKKLETVST